LAALFGCSRKKDKFLNRKFHGVTTKYNVLYNGNVALEKGKNDLIQSFQDDYWHILPIERMQVSEEILLPGAAKNQNFKRAEEKAVKAIQKHGMNIGGREKNQETGEAYLLLGKARYYDQRFIPALEAFNYILYKHPTSNKINHAKIWREKVNIRLENEEIAIQNLKRLIKQEKLSNQDIAEANAMLSQAYINLKHLDSAIAPIKIAVAYTKNKEVKGRLGIIKGQIYNRLGYKDSANLAFDEVIKMKRKTLWAYHVNAQVLKARNFDFEKGDKLKYAEYLEKLAKNRENRPFLDQIYNLQAEYFKNRNLDSLAEVYYNKSIKKNSDNDYLQSLNYRALAAYRFDNTQYKQAGAYYDSTLTKLKKNSKEFRFFKKKRENLDDVILYEEVAKRNDSILKILNYTDDEKIVYFEKYIAKLKEKEAQKEAEKMKSLVADNNAFSPFGNSGKQSSGKTFYFYNPTTVAYGKQEFIKIWGKRTLEDNWRRQNKNTNTQLPNQGEEDAVVAQTEKIADKYTTDFYISQLPTSEKAKDSIVKKRNFAYYQLGVIYQQKFKEYSLAAKKLETLLHNKPNKRLALPTKYQLYKIYEKMNDTVNQNRIKQQIVSEYPDSRYAEILQNPKAILGFSEGSPEVVYNELYKEFEIGNYAKVLADIEKYLIQFDGEEIIPKYELLKAVTLGRTQGIAAYKKALNYVALSYPNTAEGKNAQQLLSKSIVALEKQQFKSKDAGESHKLIYIFNNDEVAATELVKNIKKAIKDTYKSHLKVSADYYTPTKNFVVVHGFITPETAKMFQLFLQKKASKYHPTSHFVIASSENYKIIQLHKNLDQYQNAPKK